ncbi:broad substrate specificity ATP-binding cassette transporter ABCG2-like isoform X2 [Dysidea avara]
MSADIEPVQGQDFEAVELSNFPAMNGEVVSDSRFISFHNITYTVEQRVCFKKRPPKVILNDVSGMMKVGLHAIMGPTGSGKTSLLDVLADRKAKKGLSGHVLINGRRQPRNFKCASAYVVQDDILKGTLSVKENLMFSAALRLPASYSWSDRKEKVDKVIDELGLLKVAKSRVGTEVLRGISGGERKRTSIGMELIISPDIVFLDEPTTGLDSSTAISVIKLLKDLSGAGRVIVMAIHQPRYAIFKLFDSLTLLSNGELVYHGPAVSALDYFSKLGYVCEQHNNPADFFLDVISMNESSVTSDPDKNTPLATYYKESGEIKELHSHLEPMLTKAFNEPRGISPQYNTHFPWQLLMVSMRTVTNIIRDPLLAMMQIVLMALFAALVGVIFFQLDNSFVGVQDRIGAFFFIIMNLVFGNLNSIELFIKEKVLFRHENISGYYRVSAYFLAKVICDVLPLRVLPTMVFGAISYWMIGLEAHVSNFFIYLLTLILTSVAASGVAFVFSALVDVFALANIMAAFTYVIMMVFAGFLINLNSLADWLSWLQYISVFRYSLHALAENELSDRVFCDKASTFDGITNETQLICNDSRTIDGNEFLDDQNYSENDLWINELALLLFTIFFLMLAYIILRLSKKEK